MAEVCVCVREWILSEEDHQHKLIEWLKRQKRVSIQKSREYINNLLAGEGRNLKLEKYGSSLPISLTTVHSWMMKLDCKFDRAGQSYYTGGRERKDVVSYSAEYIEEKRTFALRQPLWKRVERLSLTQEEEVNLMALVERDEGCFRGEVFIFESGGIEYIEFHVDLLGGQSNEENDALCDEVGPEGGSYNIRFDQAAATRCQHKHEPEVDLFTSA